MIAQNERIDQICLFDFKYDVEKNNWSKARKKTVQEIHAEWSTKDNFIWIFEDSRFDDNQLLLMKEKELKSFEENYIKMREELIVAKKNQVNLEKKYDLFMAFLNQEDLNKSRDLIKKALEI